MLANTRGRWARVSSALILALVMVLMLATMASAGGPITHRVSVGGPDACIAWGFAHPGCDANFSLVAMQRVDGSSSGQYTDRFANGDGFHAVVDCLYVVGNQAWISGVITHGRWGEDDLAGMPVSTTVVDNGTNANSTPDQIAYSWIGEGFAPSCTEQTEWELFDTPQGQVKVQ